MLNDHRFSCSSLPCDESRGRPLARQLGEAHETLGLLLLGLIALHAAAALYHHFWRRDDTLRAMLPQGKGAGMHRVAPMKAEVLRSRANPRLIGVRE